MSRWKQYTFAGQTGSLCYHAKRFGVNPSTVYHRVHKRGWPLAKALHTTANGHTSYITALGETRTIKQWAAASGLTTGCIYQRLYRGWPPDDAVSVQLNTPRVRTSAERVFVWQGEEYNIAELARRAPFNISHEQMRRRLVVYGWTVERAMTTPARHRPARRMVAALGREQHVSAWARELGVAPGLLTYWLNRLGPEAAIGKIGENSEMEVLDE